MSAASKPTPSPSPVGTEAPSAAPGFSLDVSAFLSHNPWVFPALMLVTYIALLIGWKKLTLQYNIKGQPLAPLNTTLKAAFKLMYKEDIYNVFANKPDLAAKLPNLTWLKFWKYLSWGSVAIVTIGGFIPFGIGNWLLGLLGILWLWGIGHLRSVFKIRHRTLMQMFEVASGEMRYQRGAELNPWGYIIISGWNQVYYPMTTTIMYEGKYQSEDARKRQSFEINFNGTVSDQNTWTYTWESSNNRVICEPVPLISDLAPYPFPDRNPWNIFPLGQTAGGVEAQWNVNTAPHVLIAGTTGGGKSVTQRTILLHAMQSPEWRVLLIDPKRVELSAYRSHPNVLRVATELEDSYMLIQQLEQEMMSRYRAMEKAGIDGGVVINHFKDLPDPPPAILLMIDETFALLSLGKGSIEKERNDIKGQIGYLMGQIARLGRAAGISMVLATQRPDAAVLPGEVKNNLDARIAQGRMDTTPSLMTLDSDAATRLPNIKGRAILRTGQDYTEFQAYFLPPELLPKILQMASAMSQGDTSFLDDVPSEDIPAPAGDDGPRYRMPSLKLKPGSKLASWLEKRRAVMEENEIRAGRTEETRALREERRNASRQPTPVEDIEPPGISEALSAVNVSEVLARAEARQPSPLFVEPLLMGKTPESADDIDPLDDWSDPEIFDEEPATSWQDAPPPAMPPVRLPASDDSPRTVPNIPVPGVPVAPTSGAPAYEQQYEDYLDEDEFYVDDLDAPDEDPVSVPVGVAVSSASTTGATGPVTASISIAEVMTRAAARGVPIPASELLAALRVEASRAQERMAIPVPMPQSSIPQENVEPSSTVRSTPEVVALPPDPVIPKPPATDAILVTPVPGAPVRPQPTEERKPEDRVEAPWMPTEVQQSVEDDSPFGLPPAPPPRQDRRPPTDQ